MRYFPGLAWSVLISHSLGSYSFGSWVRGSVVRWPPSVPSGHDSSPRSPSNSGTSWLSVTQCCPMKEKQTKEKRLCNLHRWKYAWDWVMTIQFSLLLDKFIFLYLKEELTPFFNSELPKYKRVETKFNVGWFHTIWAWICLISSQVSSVINHIHLTL